MIVYRSWQDFVYSKACSVLYPSGTGDVKMNVFDMKFSQQKGAMKDGRKGVSLCCQTRESVWRRSVFILNFSPTLRK